MAFKFVVFAAVLAIATASHHGFASPLALASHDSISTYATHQHHAPAVQAYALPVGHAYAAHAPVLAAHEASAPAHYDYGYGVSDPLTGDHHSQQESRRGDAVVGSYSLVEADGSKRTVEYAADEHSGFNAVVHKEPAVGYAAHAPLVHAKLASAHAVAAPALVHGYAAPALVQGYAAHSVAAPALVQGYAAHSVAAPALVQGYAAHSVAAPSLVHGYAAHSVAAPSLVHGYAAHSVAAPSLVHGYSAPLVASHGLSHNVW